jgi:hypothetical protein
MQAAARAECPRWPLLAEEATNGASATPMAVKVCRIDTSHEDAEGIMWGSATEVAIARAVGQGSNGSITCALKYSVSDMTYCISTGRLCRCASLFDPVLGLVRPVRSRCST